MSELFEWNAATYGLNVPEMDSEHQVLIGHMNKLYELHQKNAPTVQLSAALDALVNYTVKHFADEEAYMVKTGFPGIKTHAGVHKQLLEQVATHVATFRSTGKLTDAFFNFLTFWLKAHIRGVDTRYAKHAAVA
ncbi:MAG: hemerythrin family protein [Steroidobacteraceae bacterium]|jgi:hemerythrin-like metal-binding protein